jgi:hypothetical protein
LCSDIGGTCITERDGYFITTGLCLVLGVVTLVTFILPTARKLQGEQFYIEFSSWQKLRSVFLHSFASIEVAYLYIIQRDKGIYFIYYQRVTCGRCSKLLCDALQTA